MKLSNNKIRLHVEITNNEATNELAKNHAKLHQQLAKVHAKNKAWEM